MSRTREDQGQDIDVARRLKEAVERKQTKNFGKSKGKPPRTKEAHRHRTLSLVTTYVMSTTYVCRYGLSSLGDHDVDGRSSCRRHNHVDRARLKHIFTTNRYAGNRATNPPHVHEKW